AAVVVLTAATWATLPAAPVSASPGAKDVVADAVQKRSRAAAASAGGEKGRQHRDHRHALHEITSARDAWGQGKLRAPAPPDEPPQAVSCPRYRPDSRPNREILRIRQSRPSLVGFRCPLPAGA